MTNTHTAYYHGFPGEYVTLSDIAEYIYDRLINNQIPHELTRSQLESDNYFDHLCYRLAEKGIDEENNLYDELAFLVVQKKVNEDGKITIYPKVVKPHMTIVRGYTSEQYKAWKAKQVKSRIDKTLVAEVTAEYDQFLYTKEAIIEDTIDWLETFQTKYLVTWKNHYDEKMNQR